MGGLYTSFLKLKRALQIVYIVNKHAFLRVVTDTGINRKYSHSTPERLRLLIEELGPTYIKFGQIIADRPDIVSEDFRKELKKLQKDTAYFRNETAIKIIESELNTTIGMIFREFDLVPYASASIGQAYVAYLKNGKKVIVKVQRPNIERKIKLDIKLMRHLAKILTRKFPDLAALNIVSMVDSFAETIAMELDYRIEQKNLELFGSMFRCDDTIIIPFGHKEYNTKRVIVMDFIEGMSPDNRAELIRNGIDREHVMRTGADAIFKMILEFGIYHADPHPGNLLITKEGRVAFIDFGMVGVLQTKELNFLADYTIGYTQKDSTLITKSFLTLCDMPYFEHEEDLKFHIHKMLLRNFNDSAMYIESFSRTLQDSLDLVLKYKLQLPPGIFLLVKTMITLEKFSQILEVDINLANIIIPYSKKIANERYSIRRLANTIYDTIAAYVKVVHTLPKDVSEIVYKMKQGKIIHEINIEKSDQFLRSIRQISLRIAYVIVLASLFLGSSILYVFDESMYFGQVVLSVSSVLIILLFLRWIFWKK